MKTLITSNGNHLESNFDLRFARAAWFCIYEEDSGEVSFVENEYRNLRGGVGNKTVDYIKTLGIQKIISGDFGPNVQMMLKELNIQMIIFNKSHYSINDIIKLIK